MQTFSEYLRQIVTPLLTRPESAVIEQTQDNMGVLLTLTVAPEDMGPIIGKQGETAKAIRSLIRIAGIKQNARVSLKVTEPDGTPYVPNPEKMARG